MFKVSCELLIIPHHHQHRHLCFYQLFISLNVFNHDVFARKEMMEEKGKVTSLRFLSWLVLGRREREEKVEEEDVLFEI